MTVRQARALAVAVATALLAGCSLPGAIARATPSPSPVRTPFHFPAGYSPSPYVARATLSPAPRLAAGRPDACALLSSTEAADALSGPSHAPVMRDFGNLVRCTWANHDFSRIIYVEVFARSGQDTRQAARMYDLYVRSASAPVSVPGAGDKAFTSQYYAVVLKGSSVLKITYQKPHFPNINPLTLSSLAIQAGKRLSG